MGIYSINGTSLISVYEADGETVNQAFDISGSIVFPDTPLLPVPTGNLTAASVVVLPDIYGNSHGWTCTGLAYDAATNTFLVGDIGKELPSSPGFASKLILVTPDFLEVVGQIDIYSIFPSMTYVQGVTIDTSDGTIWFCSTGENLIRHITASGDSIGSFSVSGTPTGIVYSPLDDSFWILTYASNNNIKRVSKTGTVLEQYTFAYNEQPDQCFLDAERGYLYITAGDNYSSRNNIYLFNTSTHAQSITCTVDSYSVEGLWIGQEEMVIVNDGYYHSAYDGRNVANFYNLS
jgi:DNA-binding beta-propeller fold protein YncE